MNPLVALLVPLALMLPAGTARDFDGGDEIPAGFTVALPVMPPGFDPDEASAWQLLVESLDPRDPNQVRIERRLMVRIPPRPAPVPPSLLADLPGREIGSRLSERRMEKCVPVSGIAGFQASGDSGLILFMRDRRMISVGLERSCRARDFYSGFLLQHNSDGKLCVDRDTLLSRSGASCRLTRMRRLVDRGD